MQHLVKLYCLHLMMLEDFQNHLTSAAHQKVMKELESLHANTAGQIRMYAQFLENRKTAGKTGLKVSQR